MPGPGTFTLAGQFPDHLAIIHPHPPTHPPPYLISTHTHVVTHRLVDFILSSVAITGHTASINRTSKETIHCAHT